MYKIYIRRYKRPSKIIAGENLTDDIDILGKYHEDSGYIIGKDLSNKNKLKEDILMISLSIHTDFHGRLR